jgi:hypothetical protein
MTSSEEALLYLAQLPRPHLGICQKRLELGPLAPTICERNFSLLTLDQVRHKFFEYQELYLALHVEQ